MALEEPELKEYFLQKRVGNNWKEVMKSYEFAYLVEAGSYLETRCPGTYRVISNGEKIFWESKSTLNNESASSNG